MQIDIKEREKNVTNPANHVMKGEKAKSIDFTWKITKKVNRDQLGKQKED